MRLYAPEKNMSVLYLALACLLYYFIATGLVAPSAPILHSESTQYVEVDIDGRSVVYPIANQEYFDNISNIYGIEIKNGDKITVENDGDVKTQRISGIKSLSLGVPIGINSASAQDLTALPGIGTKTAERIISYREEAGYFQSLDELDNVPGIGKKTMESLKGKISLY